MSKVQNRFCPRNHSLLVFSVTSGQLLRQFSVLGETHNFVFSPDARDLFLMAASNGVARVDPDTGTILQRFKDDGPIRGLSWTSSGKQLIASGKNKLLFLDPITLGVERSIAKLNVGQIVYSVMTPDGKHILAPCPIDQKVLLVESSTGKVVSTLIAGKDPIAVAIAPDGRTAYVSNGADDHASAIDLGTFDIRPFGKVLVTNGIGFRTTGNRQGQSDCVVTRQPDRSAQHHPTAVKNALDDAMKGKQGRTGQVAQQNHRFVTRGGRAMRDFVDSSRVAASIIASLLLKMLAAAVHGG